MSLMLLQPTDESDAATDASGAVRYVVDAATAYI